MKSLRVVLGIVLTCSCQLALGEIYKWVDDKGGIHYGDCPPAECGSVPVEIAPPPSDAAVRDAEERLERLRSQEKPSREGHATHERGASREGIAPAAGARPADVGCLTSLAQGWSGRIADAPEPVTARALTAAERSQLIALLRAMAGRWEGRSDDVRCAGDVAAPSSEVAVGRSRAHAWWEKDGLFRIEVDLLWDSGRSDQWFYWFDLEGDRLRFWRAQTDFSNESDLQRFDVEIVSVGSDGVTFFQRYDQGLRRTRVISLTHAGRDFRLGEYFYLEGQLVGRQSWWFPR